MDNLNVSKIKIVVFDFDETLYSGGDWSRYFRYCTGALIEKGLFEKPEDVFEEFAKYFDETERFGLRVAKYLKMKNMDIGFYRDYLNDHIYDIGLDHVEAIENKLLLELKKKYKVFMLSDSPRKHIEFYMDKFGFSKEAFDEIYLNTFREGDFSKSVYLKQIMEKYGVQPDEILMVGDSEISDIKPAKELSIQHFHVHSLDDTKNVVKLLLK